MKVNGSLVFDASSASEVQNLRVEKKTGAAVPAHNQGSDQGRVIYVTTAGSGYTANTLYIGSATAWVSIATGGDAAGLQTEVNNLETSLGSIVNPANGTWVLNQVTGPAFTGTEATLTEVLQAIANYANSNNELAELDDVTLSAVTDTELLQYDAGTSKWVNHTIGAESGVQAYDAGLVALAAKTSTGIMVQTGNDTFTSVSLTAPAAGLTITNAAGVGGSPTFALADDLLAVEGLTTSGLVSRDNATGAWVAHSLVAPTEGFTITNADGIAGSPTFALANDLAALEGLTTTGYIARTADGVAFTRSFSGTAGNIDITNGNGVASNTSINLAAVTQAATGDFVKVTLDAFGRVTGNTAVTTADITSLVDATYVNISGDTMTGNLNMGTHTVTGLSSPAGATDAATKGYVDNLVAGLTWEAPVGAMGASLPGTATTGDRFYNTTDNKIYTATAADTWDAGEVLVDGAAFFFTPDETGYVWSGTALVQFTGGGQLTAGIGLSKTGNVLDINLGAGIAQLPSDEVGIDLFTSIDALRLTTDGSTASTVTGAKLTLVLKSAGGLTQDTDGLYIPALGVTNAMLANSKIVLNADSGTDTDLNLGGTLEIAGTSAQGVSTSVALNTVTITVQDASTLVKGVAQFSSGDFATAAGVVTIKAAGVDNAQLANSVITFGDGTTTSDIALGGAVSVLGDTAAISSTYAAGTFTVAARKATALLTGVASFAAADFAVDAAAEVTLVGKALDSLTDVVITSPVSGDFVAHNGTNFVNKKAYFLYDSSVGEATPGDNDSTSHTFTHGLGQKYCNVTVVSGDEVVIPQSITFNSTTSITVTFNTAIGCKVVVMGIA